jgi:hypothetical protein
MPLLIPSRRLLLLATGGAWTPAQLGTALVGWWDATQGSTITIATGVSSWASRSPATLALTQANGVQQPAYGGNAVTFGGSAVLSLAGAPAAYGCWWVGTPRTGGNASLLYAGSTNNRPAVVTTVDLFQAVAAGSAVQYGGVTWTQGVIGQGCVSMPASGLAQGAVNGSALSPALATALTSTAVTEVGSNNGVAPWGTLNEMVLTDAQPTTATYELVVSYLARKWGLGRTAQPLPLP